MVDFKMFTFPCTLCTVCNINIRLHSETYMFHLLADRVPPEFQTGGSADGQ